MFIIVSSLKQWSLFFRQNENYTFWANSVSRVILYLFEQIYPHILLPRQQKEEQGTGIWALCKPEVPEILITLQPDCLVFHIAQPWLSAAGTTTRKVYCWLS